MELISKKLMIGAYLGQIVVGDYDLPLTREVSMNTKNVPFLVTGLVGARSGEKVVDFEVLLDSLVDGDSMTISAETFANNFSLSV